MKRYLWPVALLSASPAAAAPGIARIAAREKTLVVTLSGPVGRAVQVMALQPYETYRPGGGQSVAWKGRPEGSTVVIPRFEGKRDRFFRKLQLVDAARQRPLGAPRYVDDLSALPARRFPLPWPKSIKGLQVQDVQDAIALGVKHAGTNVMLPQLIAYWEPKPSETWEVDGEKVPINLDYVRQLDATFKPLTDAGISITAILLNGIPTKPDPRNHLIHPKTDLANAPFHLGAFNTTSARGLRWYRAAVEYLANRYSDPRAGHGWVSGYIIGNEVQAHWEWYNIGRTSLEQFVPDYGIALRVADLAARRFHAGIRTYVSMEHHWTDALRPDPLLCFTGRDFLTALSAWARREGDFPWHVAFHPYPEELFEPRSWRDRLATLSFDTPKITFKNTEVLPAFLGQKGFLYGGKPRRIILSEQGFHTPDGPDGEAIQAAAYAYAYYRLSHMPGIDAFILHRHVDHKEEGGLRLGLWTWKQDDPGPCTPDRKKQSYEVFRLADTVDWDAPAPGGTSRQDAGAPRKEAQAAVDEPPFAFALPIIGIQRWEEILPAKGIEKTPDPTPALTIVAAGKGAYRIVVPDQPDPVARYAARELQGLLAEMSGTRLPIVPEARAGAGPALLLGPCRRSDGLLPKGALDGLKEDGVLIRTAGRDVVLRGRNGRGQLYSVYVLLERYLGVRFLARDCTVLPKRRAVTLPAIHYAHSPPFMYRETLYFDSFPKEVAARQRLNGPSTQCDREVGGKIAFHPYVHSFCELVPPERYFDAHPDYFSLVGGKRTRETIHGQLCLTHPDVARIATQQVLQWAREHPDVPILDVSQNDGNGPCECPRCRAVVEAEGSEHGPILRFVNGIADVVAKRYPDKWVETLAYAYSTKPPALTKPRPNVIIRLCHAGCYFHGFERCGLGANLTSYLDAWSKRTKRVFIWHYATNFAHYLAPNQNLDGLARDIRYYAGHGMNGLMVQGDYQSPGGELAELRQYLAAQLMWDPSRDPGMIRVEFCRGYYGAAAGDVLEYLALLDETARDPGVHAFGAWNPADTASPALVAKGLEILTRARTRAETPATAKRVGRLLLPAWYLQLSFPERYGLKPEDAPQVLLEMKSVVSESKVTHVAEGGANMAGWIAEKEARYGSAPQGLVTDLFLRMGQAVRENCLDWRPATMEQDGRTLLTIFHHPKAQGHADATYDVALPTLKAGEKLALRFGTGLSGPTEDGVRFAILVDGREVWGAEQKDLPPVDRQVELTEWAGKTVRLTLRVDALGNERHDWANWIRPQIVVAP